ncbi:MAG: hypothetical protein HC905_28085 [Bacteroidales bacterium]|nr:hypothetical protein [Bacteroidales bacterium]
MYPDSEDIYGNQIKEEDINPENITENKSFQEIYGELNEKNFEEDPTAGDLDIPGTELDDIGEEIGAEDEENNYYSLGGDNHENLDESSNG